MSSTGSSATPILDQRLRLAGGFSSADRPLLAATLGHLEPHLARWEPDQVDLELAVKDRGGREQRVTLEAWIAGWPHFVATSSNPDLDRALVEVRKELIRQIEREHDRRTPKDNPRLRRRQQPE